jgi:hypothetical protein
MPKSYERQIIEPSDMREMEDEILSRPGWRLAAMATVSESTPPLLVFERKKEQRKHRSRGEQRKAPNA